MDSIDAVVIGGGVVGLACARRLCLSGVSTIVLEAESGFGQGASSRNSEVIHAGLYYQPDSLKAELCLKGRELLYEYCLQRNIGHSQIGKWIVANNTSQIAQLEKIAKVAKLNGCEEVYWLSGIEAQKAEPELLAKKVLVSPRTGIINSHEYMLSLLSDIESNGGVFVPNSRVTSGQSVGGAIELQVDGAVSCNIKARIVVNAAGILAPHLAKNFGCLNVPEMPAQGFAKGNYFSLSSKPPFQHLIYPVPEKAGLGTHLTLDMGGRARFGPDVEWTDLAWENPIDYSVDPARQDSFIKAIKAYWPDLPEENLAPDYAGIRPKTSPWNHPQDFQIQEPGTHSVPGLINLFGIESPGLTASLAIADYVAQRCN